MKTIIIIVLTTLVLSLGIQNGFAKTICLQGGGGDFVKLNGGKPDKKLYTGTYTQFVGSESHTPVMASATKNEDGTYKISIFIIGIAPANPNDPHTDFSGTFIWEVYAGDKDFNGDAYYEYGPWDPSNSQALADHLTNVPCSTLESPLTVEKIKTDSTSEK